MKSLTIGWSSWSLLRFSLGLLWNQIYLPWFFYFGLRLGLKGFILIVHNVIRLICTLSIWILVYLDFVYLDFVSLDFVYLSLVCLDLLYLDLVNLDSVNLGLVYLDLVYLYSVVSNSVFSSSVGSDLVFLICLCFCW